MFNLSPYIHGLYFKPDYVYYVQNQHVLRIIQMLCRLRVHCSQVPLLHIKVAKFLSFVFPYRTLLRSIYPSVNPLLCISFIISFYFSSVYSFVSLYQRFHNTLCVSPYIINAVTFFPSISPFLPLPPSLVDSWVFKPNVTHDIRVFLTHI